jgi:hypothetical protein
MGDVVHCSLCGVACVDSRVRSPVYWYLGPLNLDALLLQARQAPEEVDPYDGQHCCSDRNHPLQQAHLAVGWHRPGSTHRLLCGAPHPSQQQIPVSSLSTTLATVAAFWFATAGSNGQAVSCASCSLGCAVPSAF